jgi:hypothetical protein
MRIPLVFVHRAVRARASSGRTGARRRASGFHGRLHNFSAHWNDGCLGNGGPHWYDFRPDEELFMTMKPRTLLPALATLAFAFAFAPLPLGEALAQGGQRAQVWIVQGSLPRLPTQRALLGFARSHHTRRVQEITDVPIPERRWQGHLITKFNRPLGDVQFNVVFYDIEDGERRLAGQPMEVFVNRRDETVFVQRFQLRRHDFRPNRAMELVVTIRRQEVGRTRFELVGEVPRNSGIVDFTAEGT